jgi:flavin reductase (DIM6/NTAB) family NADH-FMN oxidoreductase RutF
MRIDVPLAKCYRLLNHGPVTLVTSASAGRSNVMAASWAMPLDFDPPKVLLVVDGTTLTRELIDASGEFALNIPPRALADATYEAGSRSGRELDKWQALGLMPFPATRIGTPLLEGCVAWLECRVRPEPDIERRYDLFIADVVAASADDRVFVDGRWRFGEDDLRTLHHVAGGQFYTTGAPCLGAGGKAAD